MSVRLNVPIFTVRSSVRVAGKFNFQSTESAYLETTMLIPVFTPLPGKNVLGRNVTNRLLPVAAQLTRGLGLVGHVTLRHHHHHHLALAIIFLI